VGLKADVWSEPMAVPKGESSICSWFMANQTLLIGGILNGVRWRKVCVDSPYEVCEEKENNDSHDLKDCTPSQFCRFRLLAPV